MSLEKLKAQIRDKTFERFYLLFGAEAYLVRHYKKLLCDTAMGDGERMNFSSFSGKNPPINEIMGLAETLPFFSDYRVILIENSELFDSSNNLSDLLSGVPSSTVLIFSETKVDKRNKLYKTVAKEGLAVEFSLENENTLTKWLVSLFAKNKVKISTSDAAYMVTRVGTSMDMLYLEAEKLISYVYGKNSIEKADIDAVCPETLVDRIFKLMEHVGKKDRETALGYYYDLLDLRQAPLKILSLMMRHFQILYNLKDLSAHGQTGEAASLLGIPPFTVKSYTAQCGNFSKETLRKALEDGAALDFEIKTGKMNEKIAVELLLIKYSS